MSTDPPSLWGRARSIIMATTVINAIREEATALTLSLRFPDGEELEYRVLPSDTFEALKLRLHHEGLCGPPKATYLKYGGQNLDEDADTFAMHGIETGATVYITTDKAIPVSLLLPWTGYTHANWRTHQRHAEVWGNEPLETMKHRLISAVPDAPAEAGEMIWFCHNPGSHQQTRLPSQMDLGRDVELLVMAGQVLRPNARLICEWPRRELTPTLEESDCDCLRGIAERHGLCGSRAVNGKFDTPCGEVRAGMWCGVTLILFLLAYMANYTPANYIHSDCSADGCGRTKTIWDTIGIFCFLLPGCAMCALPCCGNELRQNPKHMGCLRLVICRLQPAMWFISLTLSVFFLGLFVLHTLDLFWLDGDEKQHTDLNNEGNRKSYEMRTCDFIGYALMMLSYVLMMLGYVMHKSSEDSAAHSRYLNEYSYWHGNISVALPAPPNLLASEMHAHVISVVQQRRTAQGEDGDDVVPGMGTMDLVPFPQAEVVTEDADTMEERHSVPTQQLNMVQPPIPGTVEVLEVGEPPPPPVIVVER